MLQDLNGYRSVEDSGSERQHRGVGDADSPQPGGMSLPQPFERQVHANVHSAVLVQPGARSASIAAAHVQAH